MQPNASEDGTRAVDGVLAPREVISQPPFLSFLALVALSFAALFRSLIRFLPVNFLSSSLQLLWARGYQLQDSLSIMGPLIQMDPVSSHIATQKIF